MKLLVNKKLATRIGIITTAVNLVGMLLLWLIVSSNATSMLPARYGLRQKFLAWQCISLQTRP